MDTSPYDAASGPLSRHLPADSRAIPAYIGGYLQRLTIRHAAALEAGDMAVVADCEDRLVRVELFLVNLERWRR